MIFDFMFFRILMLKGVVVDSDDFILFILFEFDVENFKVFEFVVVLY